MYVTRINMLLIGQVTETDMYYLQDEDLARQLVELGYRGSGDTLQRWVNTLSVAARGE